MDSVCRRPKWNEDLRKPETLDFTDSMRQGGRVRWTLFAADRSETKIEPAVSAPLRSAQTARPPDVLSPLRPEHDNVLFV